MQPRNIQTTAAKARSPRRTNARIHQRGLYPAAHSAASGASLSAPLSQHLRIPLSSLRCPITSSQSLSLLGAQLFELAPVDDLHARVVPVHTPEPEIHHHIHRLDSHIAQQDAALLQLPVQRVPVVRVAREAARPHHQTLAVCDGNAHLHAKLVGLAGLDLADALDFRSV